MFHHPQNTIDVFAHQPDAGTDALVTHFQQPPANIYLLHGGSTVYQIGLLLGSKLQQPLAVIDGATKFNSYSLSKIANFIGVPAKPLLQRTFVTRSFTAFQTEEAISGKLPRFLQRTPCPLVVILGLLDTYYDEQVKPYEATHSLQRIMRTLATLKQRGINILISDVEVSNPPAGKENLFHIVHSSSNIVYQLETNQDGLYLIEEGNYNGT